MIKDELQKIMKEHQVNHGDLAALIDLMLNEEITALREDGMSWDQVANLTGVSRGTANNRWRRIHGKEKGKGVDN